jgi:small subunit ribosomal protein S3
VGQKIHPGGMRVGVIHDWKSNWYTGNKDFADFLEEDVRIRKHIYNKLSHAGLSDILIRKDAQRITIDIYTARPGIVIGKSGVEVDALRKDIHGMTSKAVHININEIKRPELDAKLVAQSIAEQLENRVSFRRAMKRSLASAIRSGAQGVKVMCGGRLGGGEMSRSESYSEGRVPLHTIRADIDYGFAEAKTTTGRIGVKVWINKGEIMPSGYESSGQQGDTRLGEQDQARRRGGRTEGLGESRQGGRGRGADREGLGPVRQRRPRRGEGGGARGPRRERDATAAQAGEQVEQPRTDEQGVSAEGREQPVIEPQVEEVPAPVADAPDTTTQKTMHDDPTKLDQSGDEAVEKKKASTKASSSKPSTTRAAKAAPKKATPSAKASAGKGSTTKAAAKKPSTRSKKKDETES